MSFYCPECGKELPDGSRFCDRCGASQETAPHRESAPEKLIGFSEMYRHPEILEAIEDEKADNIGCMWVITVLPLVGGLLIGISGHVFEGSSILFPAAAGGIVSLILLVVTLIKKASGRKHRPMWEGVVIDKTEKRRHDRHADKRDPDEAHYYTEYGLILRRDNGKKEKFYIRDDRMLHNYYSIGDRVRFHPELSYFEKYDKSHDKNIYCAVCKTRCSISKDRCPSCGRPLFK